jgi:hypothetical protein
MLYYIVVTSFSLDKAAKYNKQKSKISYQNRFFLLCIFTSLGCGEIHFNIAAFGTSVNS